VQKPSIVDSKRLSPQVASDREPTAEVRSTALKPTETSTPQPSPAITDSDALKPDIEVQ
jgi:hypothetical protein